MLVLELLIFLAAAASVGGGAEPGAAPVMLAQRKPHELGNCFQWKGCRGDSIGMLWVHAPEFCGGMAGKSWMDENGRCHDLPEGPWRHHTAPPAPPRKR